MWDKCGMARNAKGLAEAIEEIKTLRAEFWKDVRVTGEANEFNPELEKASVPQIPDIIAGVKYLMQGKR